MSQGIRAGDLPPVSQMFGAQGIGGVVPTVDIEEVFDRHEQPVPVGSSLRHELRVPLEDEGRNIMKNALNAYPETPTPENIAIPCIEVLKPYNPGKDYRPTNSAAFKAAKDKLLPSVKNLPAYKQRGDIVQAVKANQVTVVSGPAGAGKSTYIPQMLLDMTQFTKKRILHVSSSSLSSVSTTNKVAADLGVDVGSDIVGYALRLEANIKRASQLMCTTPGMTLRMLQTDKDLGDIGCVIIDEWETCDMEKELLFSLLKALLKRNDAFRVVVCCDDADGSEMAGNLHRACTETHSTARIMLDAVPLNHDVPSYYLEEAISYIRETPANMHGVSAIEGTAEQAKTMQASQNWRLCEWKDKQLAVIVNLLAARIKTGKLTGKVVIFLPSWGHMQVLAEEIARRGFLSSNTPVIPVHENTLPEMIHGKAVLSSVFSPGSAVLLTTTSMVNELPITDVELVLDAAHTLPYAYNHKVGMHCGDILPVSKLELFKRGLLAKRSTIASAACFHLIPSEQEAQLAANASPLVHGTDLRSSILLLKGISDKFDVNAIFSTLAEAPEPGAVLQAIDQLKQAALLNKDGGITPLGLFCAYLPVDFTIAKMMYYGVSMRCLDPVLTLAASLLAPPLFSSTPESIEHTVQSKLLFSQDSESDLLAGLHAYLTLEQIDDKSAKEAAFCKHNNLNLRSMHSVRRLRGILLDLLLEVNFFRSSNWTEANKNMKATTVIKSCVAAGLYPNLVMHTGAGAAAKLAPIKKSGLQDPVPTLILHPNAVGRFRKNPMATFMVYSTGFYTTDDEGKRTGVVYGATSVEPLSVVLFSGAGAGTKIAEANAGTTGKCRGWYSPDTTMAWAKNERAAYFINEARKARPANAPPDNNLPVPFTNAMYTEDSKIEVCLDQQIRLVADKSMAELAVKIRKALAAVTSQRVISLSTPHVHTMSPGLFPEQLIEMLKLLLTRCAHPSSTEHKLRAKFWGKRGTYVSKLHPVFTYVASMSAAPPPLPGPPGVPPLPGAPPGMPGMPPAPPAPPGLPGGMPLAGPGGSYAGPNQPPLPMQAVPPPAEKSLIDHLAQKVFASGNREMEQKLKAKNAGNPSFEFLNAGHPFNAYYENRLKQFADQADRPAPANDHEQAKAEARRRYLQQQGILQDQPPQAMPQAPIMHGGGVDVGFVPKRDLPQPQRGIMEHEAQGRPVRPDLPPTQHPRVQPPLPPGMPMPLQGHAPPLPAGPRIVRRPTTPKKKVVSEDIRPKTMDELNKLSTEEVLKLEKERLRLEIEQNSEISGLGDENTPVGPPPPLLMPSRPHNMGKAPGFMGQPLVASEGGGAKDMMPPVKKPSVLVGPIPAKSETKGSNLPLILAKALGETLGVRVGPTLIVGHEARIDVPSYGIEEKALKKEFFVCLGKKIGIHKNDKIQAPEKSFLAARLDILRKKVSEGYNLKRGRSIDSDDRRRVRDNRPKRRRSNSRGRGNRKRSHSDERLAIEDGSRRRPSPPPRPKRQPTPEKPKASKTPPATYKCPRCKATGEHWVKDCTGKK